ncbi:MAG: hypothetical protein IPK83_09490 [Planctomycetes bacterium]|nr:hypothetical protein [Planctomycetota bacterium]
MPKTAKPASRFTTESSGPLSPDNIEPSEVRGLEQPVIPAKPLPPLPFPRRTTQEDIKVAQADPLVRQALDLFGGSIVEVKPHRQMPAAGIESDSDDIESTTQES